MKQAKFLLMNDMHVSKDNIQEFKDNWKEAFDLCVSHNIKEIVIGGDMFQSRSSQTLDVLLAVHDVLEVARDKDINVTIAEGNHDLVDQESDRGYNSIFDSFENVFVVSDYTILEVGDGVEMFVVSYFPENGSFISMYKEMIDVDFNPNYKSILYLHEGIRGGLATSSDDELPASMFKDFDTVLVGHYHNRKKIPGTQIEYIGSSRQHNFGEDEEKGYTILYDDGSYEFVKNQINTRFRVIEITRVSDLNEDLLETIDKLQQNGKYKIKLRISCKSSEVQLIDKQKWLESGITKLEFVTDQATAKLTESQSIEKKFDKNGIKEEYSSFCSERGISVELGLKYLEKIN